MDVENGIIRAWQTIRQMLKDRGYDVTTSIGDLEVASMGRDNSTFSVGATKDILVVFHVAVQSAKKIDVFADSEGYSRIILVLNTRGSSSKPNNSTVKSLTQEASLRELEFEIFTLKELQYNVMHHQLVPEHKKIDESAIKDVMKSLCVKNRYQFPAIAQTDPVARYLALSPGDVVQIERPSPTAGKAIAYRCCRRV